MGASTAGAVINCTKCEHVGPPDDFPKEKRNTGRHFRSSWCKPCHQEKTRQWGIDNPEKYKRVHRNANVKKKYGITIEEYDELIAASSDCPICGIEMLTGGVGSGCAVLDHCHDSDEIRDVICTQCNVMLGMSKDNPDTLRAAADYLELHRG